MGKPKVLCLALALSLCLSSLGFTFQFEDYEWGRSIDEVRYLIRTKNKKLIPSSQETILSYSDTVFEMPARIYLMFAPKTKLLFMIKVVWKGTAAGERVKHCLIQRYGSPRSLDDSVDKYIWINSDSNAMLFLDYGLHDTELYYSTGERYAK